MKRYFTETRTAFVGKPTATHTAPSGSSAESETSQSVTQRKHTLQPRRAQVAPESPYLGRASSRGTEHLSVEHLSVEKY